MAAVNDVLIDAYARVAESVPEVLDGLTVEDAAWRPEPGANSITWLVWHLTRVLDGHLADVMGTDQVWPEFRDRFGLDLRPHDTGYGHSPDQVAKVVAEPALLGEYHAAVQARVVPYLAGVDDLDRIVDTRWVPPVTLGVRLVSVVDDMARHVGQAEYVRGLLQRQSSEESR